MKSRSNAQFSDINITPLTDIFLVLLIIMMVVSPMLDFKGLNVGVITVGDAPPSTSNDKPKTLLVKVDAGNGYSIEGKPIAKEELSETIKVQAAEKPDGVIIEVNLESTHEAATYALASASSAGITKIKIIKEDTRPAKQSGPKPISSPGQGKRGKHS